MSAHLNPARLRDEGPGYEPTYHCPMCKQFVPAGDVVRIPGADELAVCWPCEMEYLRTHCEVCGADIAHGEQSCQTCQGVT